MCMCLGYYTYMFFPALSAEKAPIPGRYPVPKCHPLNTMTHRREPGLFGEVVNAAEKRKPEDEPGGSEGSRKRSNGDGGTGLQGHRNKPERARSRWPSWDAWRSSINDVVIRLEPME